MVSLIVCVSEDNGTWGHAQKVIDSEEWDKVYIVATTESAKSFRCSKPIVILMVDASKHIPELENEIFKGLNGKIKDFEVALNFVSGNGKEHMALMSAVLRLGVGVRLTVLTKEGVRVL